MHKKVSFTVSACTVIISIQGNCEQIYPSRKKSDPRVAFLPFSEALFFFDIDQNILDAAVENGAEIIEGYCADGSVVLESVKEASADAVIHNQAIRRHFLFSQRLIKRLI